MLRNRDSMMAWLLGLKNHMAADLMHSFVSPVLAQVLNQVLAAQVSRQLHATASTSSRTSRSRMVAGGAESK